jgi:hypothetical protein
MLGAGDIALYESDDAGSTGGAISANTIASGVPNNLWANISDAERIAGGARYAKVFWKNNSLTDAATAPVLYAATLPTGCTLSMGLGFDDSDDADPLQGGLAVFGANAYVALASDGADTRSATIYGVDSTGLVPLTEVVALTGDTEVLSANLYSKVWAVFLSSTDAARTVSIRQGAGGTVRGTIATDKQATWMWVTSPATPGAGIILPDLAPGGLHGLWLRLQWTAGTPSVRPNGMTLTFAEA